MGPEGAGVLIISGIPGAGKTTVAPLVAALLPRSALIHGDEIHALVASDRVYPGNQPGPEADRQLLLRDRNIAALSDNLVTAGFLTVVDDVFVYIERFRRFLSLLEARPLYMAVLAPCIEVAEERDQLRPEKTVFHLWSHLDAVMRREMKGLGCWIDSSRQTPAETATEVLARVWMEGLVAS